MAPFSMMTPEPDDNAKAVEAAAADPAPVELRGFSYDERGRILGALEEAMLTCGCWVLDQRSVSPTQTALRFEVQLRSAFELYSEMIAAGVELTRESHVKMTELCTLRGHNPHKARRRRIVTVRLEVSFLEADEQECGGVAIGLA